MQTLYQEQLEEIDLYQNYKLLLDAIFNPKPKQRHIGITATDEGRKQYMRDYWQTKGKLKRAIRRGYGTHYDTRQS